MSRLLDLESIFKIATSDGYQNANLDDTLKLFSNKISDEFRAEIMNASKEHSKVFIENISEKDSFEEKDANSIASFIYNVSLNTLRRVAYTYITDTIKQRLNFPNSDTLITSFLAEKFPSFRHFDPNATQDSLIESSVIYMLRYYGDHVRPVLEKYSIDMDTKFTQDISRINREIFSSIILPRLNNVYNEQKIKQIISFIIDSVTRSFQEKYFSSEKPTPEVSQSPASPASSTQQVQQEPESLSDNPYQSEFRVEDRYVADLDYRSQLDEEDKVKKIATLTTQKLEGISERACNDFINRLSGTIEESDGRIIYEKFSNVMVAVIVCSSIAEYFGEDINSIEGLYDFFNERNNLNADPFLFLKDAVIGYTSEDPSYYDGAFTLRNFKFFERYVAMGTERFLMVGDEYYMKNVKNLLGLFQINSYNPNPDFPNEYVFSNMLVENQLQLDEIKKMKFRYRTLKNLRDKATNKAINVFHKMSGD